ncbi:hypothetical protein C8J56DRAFT_885811 [Mycena floridula]|nr:hypothetical protein C8J56DRAFT_885811 [Mycena floridula]
MYSPRFLLVIFLASIIKHVHGAPLPDDYSVMRNSIKRDEIRSRMVSPSLSDGPQLTRRWDCSSYTSCSQCLEEKGCFFDKISVSCVSKAPTDLTKVRNKIGCPQINQLQAVFPAVKGGARMGTIPAEIRTHFDMRISDHLFKGDPDPDRKSSGRHTTKSWLEGNPNKSALRAITDPNDQQIRDVAHITTFQNGEGVKTAWDSKFYSDIDIKNMCAVVLARATVPPVITNIVVQSPFGIPSSETETGGVLHRVIEEGSSNAGIDAYCLF